MDSTSNIVKEIKDILRYITSPIQFFALIFLITEALIALLIERGNFSEAYRFYTILLMAVILVATLIAFCIILYKKPHIFESSTVNQATLKEEMTEGLNTSGIVNIFQSRSVSIETEYSKRLEKMNKNLDIIGFGLSHFRRDYDKKFLEFAARGKVRILLLDPEFHKCRGKSISDLRDLEENQNSGYIRAQVNDFLKDYLKLKEKLNSDNFEVRFYHCIPTVNIFRIDDEMFIGPYLVNRDSRRTVTFLVNSKGYLFEQHMNHFEEIWNNYSRKIDE